MKTEDQIQLAHDKLVTILDDNRFKDVALSLPEEVISVMNECRGLICWVLECGGNSAANVEIFNLRLQFLDSIFQQCGTTFIKRVH